MNKVPFIVQQNVSIMSIFDLDEIRYNTISEIKLFVVKFISEGSAKRNRFFIYQIHKTYLLYLRCTALNKVFLSFHKLF